ncbi:hypothetical protein N9955_00840 [bacterium]|nr:hypothetical protein [bacterium]
MSLIINKVKSASVQVNYNYLESDYLFGYTLSASYVIDFTDVTFTNDQGVLYNGIEALREAYQSKHLTARIGGDEFQNARLTSQSFNETTLAGSSECSVSIEEEKRLDDYTSNTFAQNIPSPQLIESFQESFSFSRSEANYSSARSVSIKYKQDAGDQFLNNAKLFLKNYYFDSRPNLGYQVDGISENGRFDQNFRPKISETIDLIGLSVSLQENLQTSTIESDYSRAETYSLDVTEKGFLNKKYSVTIQALREPLELVGNEAAKTVVADLAAQNLAEFGKAYEITKGVDKDGGIVTINMSFSTDPSLNESTSVKYTISRSNKDGVYEYTISINYTGDGKTPMEKLENAKTLWEATLTTYMTKINSIFTVSGVVYEKSRTTTFSHKEGKLSESVVYTTDESYNPDTLDDGILKLKTTTTVNIAPDRVNLFTSATSNKEALHWANPLKDLGGFSVKAEATAKKCKGKYFALDYLEDLDFSAAGRYITSSSLSYNSEGGASKSISYRVIE